MTSTMGIVLAVCSAFAYTFNTLFLSFLGAKAGVTATKYILLFALLLTVLFHLLVYRWFAPGRVDPPALVLLAVSGVLGYVAGYLLMFRAIALLGPQLVLLLLTTQTILSFLLGWVAFRETVQPLHYLYAAVVVGGVILVILNRRLAVPGGDCIWAGVIFGVMLAFCQTVSQALTKEALLRGVAPMSANLVRLGVGTAVMYGYCLVAAKRTAVRGRDFEAKDWRNMFLAAAVGPFLGILLAFHALRLVSFGVAASVLQLAPVVMLFLERVFFGRPIRPVAVLGTGCAVTGTVLLSL